MPEIKVILSGLLATLTLATAIAWILQRRQGLTPSIQNLNDRIRAWWIIIIISSAALLLGPTAMLLFFTLVSALALREYLPNDLNPVLFLILGFQYLWIYLGFNIAFLLWIPVWALVIRKHSWALLICVYSVSYVPALLFLKIPNYSGRNALLVVFLVLITQASDVLQYVWGRLLGRHPVAPILSPSKTVEGLIGGVSCATALGAALWSITPFTQLQAAVVALLICSAGFLGGLLLSAIKRKRGIKDWGSLLEGHGGVLDRIDSLILSAPLFFYLTQTLN